MRALHNVFEVDGLKGLERVIDEDLFTILTSFFTNNGTREFDHFNLLHLISDDIIDPQKLARWYSSKLEPSEYAYYAKKLKSTGLVKVAKKFLKLHLDKLGHEYNPEIENAPEFKDYSGILNPFSNGSKITVSSFLLLHEYQLWSKIKIDEALSENPRTILHMPTGSGKTRTAMEFLVEQINKSRPGDTYLWIAHSTELCIQAFNSLKKIYQFRGHRSLNYNNFFGSASEPIISKDQPNITICTYGKLNALYKRSRTKFEELSRTVKVIVVDEAHKVLAPNYSLLVSELNKYHSKILGLTATPGRGNDSVLKENKALADFFYDSLVSYKPKGYKSIFNYLTEKNYLAKISYEPLMVNGRYNYSNNDIDVFKTSGFLPKNLEVQLANSYKRNLEILQKIEKLLFSARSKRILLFAASATHAKALNILLRARDINSEVILGETSMGNRQSIFKKFKSGDCPVLINFGVLTTGFDEPKLDTCLIARPCSSPVLYSQMVGRALRGKHNGGNTENLVIDVIDNIIDMPELGELFTNWNKNYD